MKLYPPLYPKHQSQSEVLIFRTDIPYRNSVHSSYEFRIMPELGLADVFIHRNYATKSKLRL